MVADKKPALGKGLSALIPEGTTVVDTARGPVEVDIDRLEANAFQPRTRYDETRLDELARSIAASGVIQPIVVRRLPAASSGEPARYQIIAGERRWRAAQRAGLHRVPVVVKDVAQDDRRRQLEMALVENIQREDLNPIEQAHAFQRLVEEFHLRQEDIAARVGKDRATVANLLRLLKLPEEVQAEVAGGTLTMGHARAIVSLPTAEDQRRIARDVISRALSVRETEAIVKKASAQKPSGSTEPPAPQKDVHTRAAEEQLHLSLGTRVEIKRRGKGGFLEIAFANEEELQRLYEYLTAK